MQIPLPEPYGAGRGGVRLAGLCVVMKHLLSTSPDHSRTES
jgi:hypothetical protein